MPIRAPASRRRVRALDDAGLLPVGERHVPAPVRQVEAGALRVAAHVLVAADEPRVDRRRVAQEREPVARVGPVHRRPAEVGDGVAPRAQLPVEDGRHRPVGPQHGVVEAVVAVGEHARPLLLGHPGAQALVEVHEERDVADLARLVLLAPPGQLALHVAGRTAEVAEADRLRVERVQGDLDVDERVGGRVDLGLAHGRRAGGVAEDEALGELHDVEVGAGHRVVRAEGDRRRHGDGRPVEARDDPPLPAHVVGRGEHVRRRRAAQRPGRPGRVGDPEREVRAACGDQVVPERRLGAGDVPTQPGVDDRDVDPRRVLLHRGRPTRCARLRHPAHRAARATGRCAPLRHPAHRAARATGRCAPLRHAGAPGGGRPPSGASPLASRPSTAR